MACVVQCKGHTGRVQLLHSRRATPDLSLRPMLLALRQAMSGLAVSLATLCLWSTRSPMPCSGVTVMTSSTRCTSGLWTRCAALRSMYRTCQALRCRYR